MRFLVAFVLLSTVSSFHSQRSSQRLSPLQFGGADYLSQLSNAPPAINGGYANGETTPNPSISSPSASSPTPNSPETLEAVTFLHAPLSFFDITNLTPKGPRANADVGQPYDSTRPLIRSHLSTGSWWCTVGGWPSPKLRATTEIFYVLDGQGRVTDTDGTEHYFGVGDTVILPKGWSGRWDVLQDIHKVWVVHDHANIEEPGSVVRARSVPYPHLSDCLYQVGPTFVGTTTLWADTEQSEPQVGTKSLFVLEGIMYVANSDGSAQRCIAGDTIFLPAGWTGRMDVIEPCKYLVVETP